MDTYSSLLSSLACFTNFWTSFVVLEECKCMVRVHSLSPTCRPYIYLLAKRLNFMLYSAPTRLYAVITSKDMRNDFGRDSLLPSHITFLQAFILRISSFTCGFFFLEWIPQIFHQYFGFGLPFVVGVWWKQSAVLKHQLKTCICRALVHHS